MFCAPFGLMVVLLMFHSCMSSMVFVLWVVDAVLQSWCGIQGQNYVALLQESGMPTCFHSRNLILGM